MVAVSKKFAAFQVRIHAKEVAMEVEADVDWVTCGMRLIVDAIVDLAEKQWNMKLIGVELALRGRMLFVLQLSRSVLPGIAGVSHFVPPSVSTTYKMIN
jgi:hypothetical protein